MLKILHMLCNQQHNSCIFLPVNILHALCKIVEFLQYKGKFTTNNYKHPCTCQEVYEFLDGSFEEKLMNTVLSEDSIKLTDFNSSTMLDSDRHQYVLKRNQCMTSLILIGGCGLPK